MPNKIKFVSAEDFKTLAKSNQTQDVGVRKGWTCSEVRSIDVDKRIVDFVISTDAVDRMGDIVSVDGWNLKAYKKNPVILFGHDHSSPPIARSLSVKVEEIKKNKNALVSRAEFMPAEISPFAFSIFQMYVQGYMKATSVGFIPLEYKFSEEKDRPYGIDFVSQELIEYSAVPVPANPEALVDARSKGIDTAPMKEWAESVLDDYENHQESGLIIPKKRIEQLRKHADPVQRTSISVTAEDQARILKENLARIAEQKEIEETIDIDEEDDTVVTDIVQIEENAEKQVETVTESSHSDVIFAENQADSTDIEDKADEDEECDCAGQEDCDCDKAESDEDDDEEEEDDEEEDDDEDKDYTIDAVLEALLSATDTILSVGDSVVRGEFDQIRNTREGKRMLRSVQENCIELANLIKSLDKQEEAIASEDDFVLELATDTETSDDGLIEVSEEELALMVEAALPEILAAHKAKLMGKVD